MNYIQKLLNGEKIEWKTLGEVVKVITAPSKLKKEKYQKEGLYPIIDQGEKFVGGFTDEELPLVRNGEYVIFGDHSEHIKYVDFPFIQGADGLKILKPEKDYAKYIYYAFQNFYIKEGNYKRHWSSAKETKIPIPPLAVQQKIAEILDRFAELEAELEAELHLREKQYNYYRNHLLTPNEEGLLNGKKVEWKSLGEICDVLRGRRLTKRDLVENGSYPVYHGGIEPIGYYNQHNREANSTMIINVGASAGTVGFSDREFWSSDGCYCFSHNDNVSQRFLFYFLQNMEIAIKSKVRKAGIPTLDSNVIEKIKIPIPPMEEQERIVKILDKFDTLANSISEGLPKEIALRRKQYEYYREQLLSFPEN